MGSGGIVEREELYPGLNGELRRIHLMKTPLFDTDQGLVGLQGIFWDVTERWQAEQALRAAESRYRNLFENAVEGIFQTTAEGRIILANPALARMFGYASAGELMGAVSSVADQLYLNPEDRRAFQRLIAKRGEVRDFEVRQCLPRPQRQR
jgi:PAS domain-containing protein